MIYHVLNRGVGKQKLFFKDEDYLEFESVMAETLEKRPMRMMDRGLDQPSIQLDQRCEDCVNRQTADANPIALLLGRTGDKPLHRSRRISQLTPPVLESACSCRGDAIGKAGGQMIVNL